MAKFFRARNLGYHSVPSEVDAVTSNKSRFNFTIASMVIGWFKKKTVEKKTDAV